MRTALVGLATALVMAIIVVMRMGGLSALASGGDGSYAFLNHQPGYPNVPVTYSSCKPIKVELNLDGAKNQTAAKAVLLQAMGEISAASHLNVVYVGPSRRRPHWPDDTITVEGGAWPVLIGFATPEQVPSLKGGVAGVGGSAFIERNSSRTYVTGQIAIDKDWFNDTLAGSHGTEETRAVVMHELGHVLGLNHVEDRGELMFHSGNSSHQFGPGDRRGLALLGQGPCV